MNVFVAGIGCKFQDTTLILQEMDVEESNMALDFAIMATFFVGLRLLGYIVLRLRVRFEK